jgi:hypothetical protein
MRKAMIAAMLVAAPVPAFADTPVVQPVQTEGATVRFNNGRPVVDMQGKHGAIQVSPAEMDHGSLAFSVGVFNSGDAVATLDVTNFEVVAGTERVGALSKDELEKKAKNRAMWSQIGVAMLAGVAAAAESSQTDTYRATTYTPHGTYRTVVTTPCSSCQVAAVATVAAGGYAVARIQSNLEETRARLNNEIIQMSTIDPQTSYGGVVVMRKLKSMPKMVDLHVRWNGDEYVLRFQVAKRGTPQPTWTAFTPPPPAAAPATDGAATPAVPAAPVSPKKDGL